MRRSPGLLVVVLTLCLSCAGLALDSAAEPGPVDSTATAASDSLTVIECWRIARERAPLVGVAALERRAASADSLAAMRTRRPAFSLFGGATVAPSWSYDPAFTNLGDYNLRAGVQVPLFDGGDRALARSRASAAARQSAFDLEIARRDAGLRAAALAIQILLLTERERARRETVEWLDRLTSLLESAARGGSRSVSDARRAELELEAQRSDLASIEAELPIARRELGELLGRPDSPPAIRAEPGDMSLVPEDSLRVMARLASLPDLEIARIQAEQRRLDLLEVQRRNALRLNTSADAGLAGTDLTHAVPPDLKAENPNATLADRLKRDLGASASFDFKQPILDSSLPSAIAARRAGLDAASARVAAELATQRRTSLDLIARWRAAEARLISSRVAVTRADDLLLRLKSLYASGSATLLELLDARQVLANARELVSTAGAELQTARFELEARR